MGMSGISKSQVSRLCVEIDDRVKAFLDRPIEGDWPYLWMDATYIKVRRAGRIVSVAVIIADGVNSDGRREVLGMAIGNSEAEVFWTDFLRSLACRGLRGVKLVISDSHERSDDRPGVENCEGRQFEAAAAGCGRIRTEAQRSDLNLQRRGDPAPGHMEADLVSHSGPMAKGSWAWTITLTDIATGWTECAPLLVREQTLLVAILSELRKLMSFPLLGFDSDNDRCSSMRSYATTVPRLGSPLSVAGPIGRTIMPGLSRKMAPLCVAWWNIVGWRDWKRPGRWRSCTLHPVFL
jgi:hypothetical protein